MCDQKENRLKSFKSKVHISNKMKEERTTTNIRLRKEMKDSILSKRRGFHFRYDQPCNTISKLEINKEEITCYLNSALPELHLKAFRNIREILELEKDVSLDLVIQTGVLPICVKYLKHSEKSEFLYEASWILAYLSSGDYKHTMLVLETGIVADLARLLSFASENICEQIVMILGNIARSGSDLATYLFQNGILQPLFSLAISDKQHSVLTGVVWTISNIFCNCESTLLHEVKQQFFPVICRFLSHPDFQLVAESCWALSYMTNFDQNLIQKIINSDIILHLKGLLSHNQAEIVLPTLRVIGNIAAGDNVSTDAIINCNILPLFHRLLRYPNTSIQKEVSWILSNITAGTTDQIQAVLDAELMIPVAEVLTIGDYSTKVEAVWIITNIVENKCMPQIVFLAGTKIIPPLCQMLNAHDPKIISNILNILKTTLKLPGMNEKISIFIEECGGLEYLEKLKYHENSTISEGATEFENLLFSEKKD